MKHANEMIKRSCGSALFKTLYKLELCGHVRTLDVWFYTYDIEKKYNLKEEL